MDNNVVSHTKSYDAPEALFYLPCHSTAKLRYLGNREALYKILHGAVYNRVPEGRPHPLSKFLGCHTLRFPLYNFEG